MPVSIKLIFLSPFSCLSVSVCLSVCLSDSHTLSISLIPLTSSDFFSFYLTSPFPPFLFGSILSSLLQTESNTINLLDRQLSLLHWECIHC